MTLFDSRYRAIDSFDLQAVDDDGNETTLTWDEETQVTIDNQPWEDAFGTDTFHKAEYVVTAPAEQPYFVDGSQYTFTKPRDELKQAQWRLDNLPWTIEHPPSKRVVDVDEARGFWRGPYYDEAADQQRAALYVPANDEEALQYAAEHEGVSVGFTNDLVAVEDYDGAIGGDVTLDNVDALQTNIYYDHVATVETPRLPTTGRIAGDALPTNDDGEPMDMSALATANDACAGIATVDSADAMHRQSRRGSDVHRDEMADITVAPQAGGGRSVTVDFAVATQRYWVSVHTRGDEYQYLSPSLSPPRGVSGPHEANTVLRDHEIRLSEPLGDDTEIFVALNFADPMRAKAPHMLGSRGFVTERSDVIVTDTLDAASTTLTKASAVPEQYEFDTEDAAQTAADQLGCSGAHERDGVWYPCSDHEALNDTLVSYNQTIREEMDGVTADEAPSGIHVEDGTWYAIGPDENSDGEAKYPLTSCTGEDSIESALKLAGHGHYDIEQSTLEARIERAASAMDCDTDDTTAESTDSLITMTDGLDLDDMTVDAIAEKHDGVAEAIEEKNRLDRQVDELEEQKQALTEERDSLREQLDDYRESEKERELEQKIDALTDLTEKWDEDDLREMEVDSHEEHVQRLDERIELFSDGELVTDASTPTADNGEGNDNGDNGSGDGYEAGEVYDLSNTA